MSTPRRILVVDDEDHLREVAELSLHLVGDWEVTTASSGEAAIDLATSDPPDAILLDVMMPGMDGPTVFRHLRAHPATAHVPVILLTAKLQPADRARFGALGVDGIIGKPFEPMDLPGQVTALLAGDR
jgi:CheY-like chemotaxis protein